MLSAGLWGRWGDDEERGSLNRLDPQAVLCGVGQVSQGRVVSLAQKLGPLTPHAPHRSQIRRFMDRDAGDYASGARSPGGFRFAEDIVQFPTCSDTHIDALSHVWSGDTIFNWHPSNKIRSTTGAQHGGAEKLGPIVGRGVLLDLAPDGALAPGNAVNADGLQAAAGRARGQVQPGDIVLLRTGYYALAESGDDYLSGEPGIDIWVGQWLVEHGVAVVGSDNYAVEVIPVPGGETFPVHLLLIWENGIPLIEGLVLDELAAVTTGPFLFIAASLPLVGSTSSPLHPVDQEVLRSLVRSADVLVEGFRPGVMARPGVPWEVLQPHCPHLVFCSISGFGAVGQYPKVLRHDLNLQAWGSPPVARATSGRSGVPWVDLGAATAAALAIVAAWHRALKTGEGSYLDVALSWSRAKPVRDRLELTYAVFATAAGSSVVLGLLEDHFWPRLCAGLGLNEWTNRTELATYEGRIDNATEVYEGLVAHIGLESLASLLEMARDFDIPLTPTHVADDEQTGLQVTMRGFGRRACGTALPGRPQSGVVPSLGGETERVVAALGHDETHPLIPTHEST